MLIIFGIALLIVAAAVVMLFAMLGELATRIPAPGPPRRDPVVQPLEEARLGSIPAYWPPGLRQAGGDRDLVLIVLSTVCSTCADIAFQLTEEPGHSDWGELAVVVSTGSESAGQSFITQHRLTAFRWFIDTGGDWISQQFGVRVSPTALAFSDGRLSSAYGFHDVAALRAKIAAERNGSLQKETA
jgi:hypothetical protein